MKESGKENERRPVDGERRCAKKGTIEACDIGLARDETFEVAQKTEIMG